MATTLTLASIHPKHNIYKFRDIKPKLRHNNWILWKHEVLPTARDRGLYATILGTDPLPHTSSPNVTKVGAILHIGSTPLTQLIDEWNNRNNVSYSQILLCISPKLQTAIDNTDVAAAAWAILIKKYESMDPSKISIIRKKREPSYGGRESVVTYLTIMKEYRNQLEKMGEVIAPSSHAATILRNVPKTWRSITQTIRMITQDVEIIEGKLEAHESNLNAIEVSNQAAMAFIPQLKNSPCTNQT